MNPSHAPAASESEPLPRPDAIYREAWLQLHDAIVRERDSQPERAITASTWETVLRARGARDAYDVMLATFDAVERGLGINPRS